MQKKQLLQIFLLAFACGLPRLLVASTLSARLVDAGVQRAAIGLFAYVALPYAFHFVWAPLMDNLSAPFGLARLGRRRGWILLTQILLVPAIILLGILQNPIYLALAAVLVAFLSSSQDVVSDAFRAEYIAKENHGEAASLTVFGYRVGMLASGAGALFLAQYFSWQFAYLCMAALLPLGMLTVWWVHEPEYKTAPIIATSLKDWLRQAFFTPFKQFAQQHKNWLHLLAFIMCFRLAEGFVGFMSTPFFLDIGFNKEQIATIAKLYGFGATLAGTFLGGMCVKWLGMKNALLVSSLTQILGVGTYIFVASLGANQMALAFAITADNLAAGMAGSIGVAFLMGLTNPAHTATQYALLGALATFASTSLAGGAGWVAQNFGWQAMFTLAMFLGLPAIWLWRKL